MFSLSVVEHIPDDGDSSCVAEIARVLVPGGECYLTVPFWPQSRSDYVDDDAVYWTKHSVAAGGGKVFYQRRYSEEDLFERLIRPSGLTLKDLKYVGEKVMVSSDLELVGSAPVGLWADPAVAVHAVPHRAGRLVALAGEATVRADRARETADGRVESCIRAGLREQERAGGQRGRAGANTRCPPVLDGHAHADPGEVEGSGGQHERGHVGERVGRGGGLGAVSVTVGHPSDDQRGDEPIARPVGGQRDREAQGHNRGDDEVLCPGERRPYESRDPSRRPCRRGRRPERATCAPEAPPTTARTRTASIANR